jgi:dihydrofolate reductase
MATVITNMSMSLDGFVADPQDGVEELFGWYANGPVEVVDFGGRTSHLSEASAAVFREALASAGAFVVGRRLYDMTGGWGGRPPAEAPMVVLTHEPPAEPPPEGVPITFAATPQAAIADARALAGDRVVAVAGGETARACLDAGLIDEVAVNLVPVILGRGIPFFAGVAAPVRLSDPDVVEAEGVTHLRYRVIPAG